MIFNPLNRFDRIIAVLILLQSKRVVTAQELADRFGVSLRTVYRDIRSLESAGVPIAGEAGVGYSVMDGYRLPPVMFTREEAGSFVAAEKLMEKFTDKTLGAYYESAMMKLKSVLRESERDMVTALEAKVSVLPDQELFNNDIPDALEILFESIAEKRQVYLKYRSFSSEMPTERMIEPVGLFYENNSWYVVGYCHLRSDYRQFRTDRMAAIKRSRESFTRKHGTVDQYRTASDETPKTKIRISVDKEVIKFIRSGRKYHGFVSEQVNGDHVEMTFMTECPDEGFARWFMMFGDFAHILEPDSLKDRVAGLTEKIRGNLQ